MSALVEWRFVRLGQLAEVRTGLSKNRGREGPTITRPYLRVANVQDGRLDLSDVQEIDVPSAQVARFTLQKGDLLLIEGNGNPENLGRGCLWNGQIPGAVHQNHVFAVRVRPDAGLLPKFLELQVQSDFGRGYFLSSAKGSTGLSTLNSRQIDAFPIYLPPINVQERIVSTVGEWTRSIEVTERLIKAKRRVLDYLRQKLYVEGAQGWSPRKLGQVLREHGGTSSGVEPVYSVSVHKGLVDQIEHLGRSFAASDTSHYNLVRPGDVVYTKSPTGDFPYGVVKQSHVMADVIVSPLYGVFTPASPDIGLLVDFFFESPVQSLNYLRPLVQKGAKNTIAITNDGFLAGSVRLPCNDAAERAAAALVRDARREIAVLADEAAALRTQRRGLMQKLLTGKWRVPTDEGVTA